MTMSCPEGLNDILTSESNINSLSTASENDESSDCDSAIESAGSDQDDDAIGRSLPNLSQKQTHPSMFIQIIKKVFSSSTGNLHSVNETELPGKTTISEAEKIEIMNRANAEENVVNHNKETDQMITFSPKITTNSENIDDPNLEWNHNPKTPKIPSKNAPQSAEAEDLLENSEFTTIPMNEKDEKTGDLNSNVVKKIEFQDSSTKKITKRVSSRKREKKPEKSQMDEGKAKPVSARLLWLSIITMPMKLRYLCFSLLTSFMGIEVLLMWYTNIFGSVIYGGDPTAPANSTELQLYNDGVHMGCWGLTIHAVTMMLFSVAVERFDILNRVSLRIVYAGAQLLVAFSSAVMFFFPNKTVMLCLSWTIGIMVNTSLTIPYVLVGKYHQEKEFVMKSPGATRRGYGTDCAILACQMYAGNLMYAAVSGPAIAAYGGVKIVLIIASFSHFVAFILCAWFVTYPGERTYKFCSRKSRTNSSSLEI